MIAQHCAKSYTGESVIESEENQYFANVMQTAESLLPETLQLLQIIWQKRV